MTFRKALAVSALIVFVVMLGLLLWGLMSGSNLHIPLLLDVSSDKNAAGDVEASMEFSPIGPVLAVGVLAGGLAAGDGRVGEDRGQRRSEVLGAPPTRLGTARSVEVEVDLDAGRPEADERTDQGQTRRGGAHSLRTIC